MRFVECISGKACYIVEDLCSSLLGNAALYAAVDLTSLIIYTAIHEEVPVILHYGLLLFAHCTSDVIGLSHRETCKISYDLHYLFLIDRASVCNV